MLNMLIYLFSIALVCLTYNNHGAQSYVGQLEIMTEDPLHADKWLQTDIYKNVNKPAILHCRAGKFAGQNSSVFPNMIEALKKSDFSNGVMHCYSGTKKEAEIFLEMGLMISFTGIITYERNQELRDIIKMMPIEKLMIETDSPFLPPMNHRGEKNEPAFVIEVAKTIAEVRNLSVDEVLDATSGNAEGFFGI